MKKFAVIFLMLLLSGCGTPRIDASSEESLKESVQNVRKSLRGDERAEFDDLMAEASASVAMAKMLGSDLSLTSIFQPIDGMTGAEALAFRREQVMKAEAERKDRERKELEENKRRAAELEELVAARTVALDQMAKGVLISDPTVREEGQRYGREHRLYATVRNNLDIPLANIRFTYAVRSPDRAVPWREGEGYFFIDGGLEPGEERTLRGSSKIGFGGFILAFNALKEHPEAKLSISIVDASGADNRSIIPPELSSFERVELEGLRTKLAAE